MFDRVHVVTLARRADRLARFFRELPADWPFATPEPFPAVDGQAVPSPSWWRQGKGAWGCYRSHLTLIERALNDGLQSVLLLEDDALPVADFTPRVSAFLAELPDDWQMLYLGGQLIRLHQGKPMIVSDQVLRPHNVHRTHAYALRGREAMTAVYRHLHEWSTWKARNHIDHHFGMLHESGRLNVYCPREWLIAQAAGTTDVKADGRRFDERLWPAPIKHAAPARPGLRPTEPATWLVVLGLHSSGSSALAGVCYHLGCHMGARLTGYYGSDPQRSCGFENAKLARLCEAAIPFPATQRAQTPAVITTNLRTWMERLAAEAQHMHAMPAFKYPLLCELGDALIAAAGPAGSLLVVHADRPLEQSIASLVRRCPHRNAEQLAAHQRWLYRGKQAFLAEIPTEAKLHVSYDELLSNPRRIAQTISDFAGLQATDDQIARAAAYVDPSKRHVS
jgi:hypothetical protein